MSLGFQIIISKQLYLSPFGSCEFLESGFSYLGQYYDHSSRCVGWGGGFFSMKTYKVGTH